MEVASCGKCLVIEDSDWDEKEFLWEKTFYVIGTPMVFHIPIRIGRDFERAVAGAKSRGYGVADHPMILNEDGLFRGKVLVEVEGADESDPNVLKLEGAKIRSRVTDRPWKEMGRVAKRFVTDLGQSPRAFYFWYTTCPECSKERGYKTVMLARI